MKKSIIMSLSALAMAGALTTMALAQPVKTAATTLSDNAIGVMFKSNTVLANTYSALGTGTYSDTAVAIEGNSAKTVTISRAHYSTSKATIALGDTEDATKSILNRTDTTDPFTNIATATGQKSGNMQAIVTNFKVTNLNDIHLYWAATEAGYIQIQSSSDDGTTWAIIKTDDNEQSTFAAPTTHNTSTNTDWNYNTFTWKSSHVTDLASTPVRLAVVYFSFGGVAANYCHIGGLVVNALQAAKNFADTNTDCAAFKASNDLIDNLIAIKASLTSDDIAALNTTTMASASDSTYLARINMFLNAAGKDTIPSGANAILSVDSKDAPMIITITLSAIALSSVALFFVIKKKKANN
jgi:hypothetical protein